MISATAYLKIKTKQKSWEIGIGAFWAKKKKKRVCFWGARWRVELQFLILNMNVFFKRHRDFLLINLTQLFYKKKKTVYIIVEYLSWYTNTK